MKLILPAILLLCLSANAQQKFTVYFEYDKAVTAQNVQQWIEANPNARIEKIYGYTDSNGSEDYNMQLSQRRADYIYERLKGSGLTMDGVELKGFGESESTRKHNAKDRKVVIYYAGTQIQPAPMRTDLTTKISTAQIGDKIVLNKVYFKSGTAYIVDQSLPVLKELYTIMRDNPKLKIDLQGHICCQTTDLDKLSEKRAMEIYLYLKNGGINENRMTYRGFGSTRPIHPLPEKSPDDMIANRRVEIEILAR